MNEGLFLPLNLPSAGRVYPIENIKARPLVGADEVILALMNPMTVERKFLELLRRVVTGIDPASLTFGDRLYLMLWLSINSVSDTVRLNTTCSNCLKEAVVEVDLRSLNVIPLPPDFKSPVSIETALGPIGVNLLTVADLAEAEKHGMEHDDVVVFKHARTLWGAGCETLEQKIDKYSQLPVKDTARIRAVQEDHFHGPDLRTTVTCAECGQEEDIEVPFRLDMLFPTGEVLRANFGKGVQNRHEPARDVPRGVPGAVSD